MKCKTKHLVFGFGFVVVSTVFVTILCFSSAHSQAPVTADIKPDKKEEGVCKGHHRSKKDFYNNVRMFPPAAVLEIVGNRVNYAIAEEGIELGSLELEDGYSVVPRDFTREKHGGCYGLTYCHTHLVILTVESLPQSLCQTVKQ